MSGSPIPDTSAHQVGVWQPGSGSRDVAAFRELRTRLGVALILLAVLAVCGIAAVAVAAADYHSLWPVVLGLAVVFAGCTVALLVSLLRMRTAVDDLGARAGVEPVEFVPPPTAPPAPAPVSFPGPAPAPAPSPAPAPAVDAAWTNDLVQHREVFGNLAQRLQSLIHRAIQMLDELEREVEDPDLLGNFFKLDHLVTRMLRQAENLAVLGGNTVQRQTTTPVPVYTVLRSALSEIEHYRQVTIVQAAEGIRVRGHVLGEIIHLLAELLENATKFSPPDGAKIRFGAEPVARGLAIRVEDRGLGMPSEQRHRLNTLLDGSGQIDLGELLEDGRIGLAAVRELARRHDVRVRLESNIFDGIDAFVVLPHSLIESQSREEEAKPTGRPVWDEPPSIQEFAAPERAPQQNPVPTPEPVERPAAPVHTTRGDSDLQQRLSASGGDWERPRERTRGTPAPYVSVPSQPVQFPTQDYVPEESPKPTSAPRSANGSEPSQGRPALPKRTGSHLVPELRERPAEHRSVAEPNTNLMGTFWEGLDRASEEQAGPADGHHHNS